MAKKNNKKTILRSIIRFIEFRLLHIQDSAHRIALGVALGLFVAWTPFYGLHLFILALLAILLRANKFVAFTFVWVNNPFTLIFIYYPSYLLGKYILDIARSEPNLSQAQVKEFFENFSSVGNILSAFYQPQFWQQLGTMFTKIGAELLIGTFIIGSAVAASAYFATYTIIKHYRTNNPHRRFQKYQ